MHNQAETRKSASVICFYSLFSPHCVRTNKMSEMEMNTAIEQPAAVEQQQQQQNEAPVAEVEQQQQQQADSTAVVEGVDAAAAAATSNSNNNNARKRNREPRTDNNRGNNNSNQANVHKIYVKDFQAAVSEEDVKAFFSRAGTIVDLLVRETRMNAALKYAFIGFATKEEADAALAFNGQELGGAPLVIEAKQERVCFKCNKPGHLAVKCREEQRVCRQCGKAGHIAKDCKGNAGGFRDRNNNTNDRRGDNGVSRRGGRDDDRVDDRRRGRDRYRSDSRDRRRRSDSRDYRRRDRSDSRDYRRRDRSDSRDYRRRDRSDSRDIRKRSRNEDRSDKKTIDKKGNTSTSAQQRL
jgi:RNA recognition motif-containing protein